MNPAGRPVVPTGTGKRVPGIRRYTMEVSGRSVTAAAFAVALVATAGSQFYEHGVGLYPCSLCWYQRVLMYPLVVILGEAVLVDWHGVHRRVLPFVVPGIAVAAYHSWLQLDTGSQCAVGGCATVQFRLAGILTIPNQALVAFVLVGLLMGVVYQRSGVDAP